VSSSSDFTSSTYPSVCARTPSCLHMHTRSYIHTRARARAHARTQLTLSATCRDVPPVDCRRSVLSHSSVPIERCIPDLIRDCSLHYALPRTSLTPLLTKGVLSVQQVAYAYVAWKYAFHFLSRDIAEIKHIQLELVASSRGSEGLVSACRVVSPHSCFVVHSDWCGGWHRLRRHRHSVCFCVVVAVAMSRARFARA
jgi:hypothetical protein